MSSLATTEKGSSPPDATTSWTGNVWIQDEWTEEDKSQARDRLLASSSSATATQQIRQDVHEQQLDEQVKQQQQQQKQAYHEFRRNASTNWNVFYQQNKTNFFKDRHYLHKAFPNEFGWLYVRTTTKSDDDEVGGDALNADVSDADNVGGSIDEAIMNMTTNNVPPVGSNGEEDMRIVEIGCGVGNAILPLLEQHSELVKQYHNNHKESTTKNSEVSKTVCSNRQEHPPPKLHIHCLDFAPTAIQLLQKDARFQSAAKEGRATAHVYDLSSMHPSTICIGNTPDGKPENASFNNNPSLSAPQVLANSADVAILLFCLSAIGPHPSPSLERAARHVMDMLKPGGILVLRDYGRLDEAQLKLGSSEKELGENFYRKGDGTGCYYFELDDLRDLFVSKDEGDNKLELLELDYIQRVYRNRGDGTTRRRVWVQGRFLKPLCSKVLNNGASDKTAAANGLSPAPTADDNGLQHFFDTSVKRWDEYYKALPVETSTTSSSPLPSNLFQMYPDEFQPWLSWQPSNKKGKGRQQQMLSQPSYQASDLMLEEVTIIDVGCGLGNNTLLNLVERQQLCHEEERQNDNQQEESSESVLHSVSKTFKPPMINVHFLDASNEAIQRLCSDSRYQSTVASNEELAESNNVASAKIASQVCDLTSSTATAHLKQSANIILLLFTLSSIGPYQQNHKHDNPLVNAVKNAASMLKPGGVILFRDYARYDDDQLQLNSVVGAQLCENFYLRPQENNIIEDESDHKENNLQSKGTGCYFFELEEVRELFLSAGLDVLQLEYTTRVYKKSGKNARNCNKNGGVVNRTRVWVNGRFRKPIVT